MKTDIPINVRTIAERGMYSSIYIETTSEYDHTAKDGKFIPKKLEIVFYKSNVEISLVTKSITEKEEYNRLLTDVLAVLFHLGYVMGGVSLEEENVEDKTTFEENFYVYNPNYKEKENSNG